MNPVQQQAIVIGGVNYSDSSRVVWMLTPDYGRQSFLVKGARRQKSKYLGSLETFNLVRVSYRRRERSSLYTLGEVDVENHFGGIRRSLDAFWAASQATGLIKLVSHEEQEGAALFELLSGFLSLTDKKSGDSAFLASLLAAFRWRLISLVGLEPQLVECVRCEKKLTRAEKYRFLLMRGGVCCAECAGAPDPADLAEGRTGLLSYEALRFIYRSSRRFPAEPEDLLQLTGSRLGEVEELARRYLAYHLDEKPREGKIKPGAAPPVPMKPEFSNDN
jgi:DNA repair protein RecO (recombination protein O)